MLGALLIGGLVKGVIGLGLPTVALTILASVLGLREALPLVIMPIVLTNVVQAVQGGGGLATMRRFWLLNLCAFAGVWLGADVLFAVDPLILTGVLGLVIGAYALVSLAEVRMRVGGDAERWLSAPIGLATGLMTGMTGSAVFPAIPYLQSLDMDREALMRALGLAFLFTSLALVAALADYGALSRNGVTVSTLALAPAFLGMYLGQRVRKRLSHDRFQRIFFVGLLLMGAHLVIKGFG